MPERNEMQYNGVINESQAWKMDGNWKQTV